MSGQKVKFSSDCFGRHRKKITLFAIVDRVVRQDLHIEMGSIEGIPPEIVRSIWVRPSGDFSSCFVFAHGAGAGMDHFFMETMANLLAERGVATLRYNFPYMEKSIRLGKRHPPNPARILTSAIGCAIRFAQTLTDKTIFLGGKSMGGRMASQLMAEDPVPEVRGLILVGYPLHAPRKLNTQRARHLHDCIMPQLYVQGTRDAMAAMATMEAVCDSLPRATLHKVLDGDHSFRVLKRTGVHQDLVYQNMADAIALWISRIVDTTGIKKRHYDMVRAT